MEGKKISFGFKKVKKAEKPVVEEQKDFIGCVEEKSIKVVGGEKATEKEPHIIPMKPNTLITAEKLKQIAAKEQSSLDEPMEQIESKEDIKIEPMENETLDQMAVGELLLEVKEEVQVETQALTVPIPAKPVIDGQKEMLNSNCCVPNEFLDVLNDVEEQESDDDVIEDVEVDDMWHLRDEFDRMNLQRGTNVFIVGEDGSLAPVAMPESESIVARNESDDDTDDDADQELQLARQEVLRAISPLTRPGTLEPSSSRDPLPEVTVSNHGFASLAVRGRGRRSRRGSQRGRGSVVSRGERQRRFAWSRGKPLVERFATAEELPTPLREEIERVTAERERRDIRERGVRERRTANQAEGEDVSDVENDEVEDQFFDAEEFVWTSMNEWNGEKETFLPESSGPTRIFENAYDAFRAYWDDSILSHIVKETNRYALGIESARFHRDWFETNIDEILILFAFWQMLGILKLPTIKSCFSKLPILRTEIFRTMFSEDRHWNLNRAFHLANGSRDPNDPDNVLYPMGPIINELNIKFQQNYQLHQDICIDESLTLWKGPLGFKQFIKTKSARFGIKTYQLCESTTGYLWSFFVYIGRRTSNSTLPSNISTVVKLIQPLMNLGHVLYMDNWFNSPTLARYLKRRRTDCVGTLRPSRRNVPAVIQRTPLFEGEFVARQSGDVMVVALQDRKRLTCISTFHGVTQVHKEARTGRSSQYKLQLVDDYNQSMGGVDRLDQMLEPYLVERKQCVKWTMKLFKRLLNITVQNARILLEQSNKSKISSLSFRLALVQDILDRHLRNVPRKNPNQPPKRPCTSFSHFPAERLTERHFIRRIPITDEMRATVRHASNLGRRQCVWCTANGRKSSRTAYECPNCKVALCLDFCFEQFHTIAVI